MASLPNVYTVPTQPKFGQETNRGSDDMYYPPSVGGIDLYPLDSDTEDSESALGANGGLMVDVGGSNWKLLSQFNQEENGQVYDLKKAIINQKDSRDMHVFTPSDQVASNRVPTKAHHYLPAHFVAETNL